MRYIRVLLCIALIGFASVPWHVQAAFGTTAIDVQVQQGEKEVLEIPLRNDRGTPAIISVSLLSASFSPDGAPILGSSDAPMSWVTISEPRISLDAGATETVRIAVAPGTTLPSGSYVVAAVATETLEGTLELQYGTATLIFITVGNPNVQARCADFSRLPDGSFSLTLENSGQGILYEEGEIVLRGPFDIAFNAVSSNPALHRVFTGQTRTWSRDGLKAPWWAFGPLNYSFESDSLLSTCSRISAGFGWFPIVGIAGALIGALSIRRRK